MAATKPLSISSIRSYIARELPDITLTEGTNFLWNPSKRSIEYNSSDENYVISLLHELGHAQLQHADYSQDITLVTMEAQAWQRAKIIAQSLGSDISDELIQADLDTYRDWMHARSVCPDCSQNGVQIASREYTCPICHTKWHVNEARNCRLRRYKK